MNKIQKLISLIVISMTGCKELKSQIVPNQKEERNTHSQKANNEVQNLNTKKSFKNVLPLENEKLIKVSGYFGSESFAIKMDSIISIQDLIDTVHKSTGFPKTYAMSGGVPPNRKSFQVPYDYRINGINSREFDRSTSLLAIVPPETQIIRFEIIYIPRVD